MKAAPKKGMSSFGFCCSLSLLPASIYCENTFVYECPVATIKWNATAKAWMDEDMNQIWDENAPPLAGVHILAEENQNKSRRD